MWFVIWSIMAINDVSIFQNYDAPNSEEIVQHILAAIIDRDGHLYVLDAGAEKVFVWRQDGTYKNSFGRSGNGPGELNKPVQICVIESHIIVWQMNGLMSFFDKDGNFQYRITVPGRMPKRFVGFNDGQLLIGFRHMIDGDVFAVFEKRSRENGAFKRSSGYFIAAIATEAGYDLCQHQLKGF